MARIPPRMILSKPCQFFNITPINQMGITIVDLGDIDEASEAPRSSSLPPTSVKGFEDIEREIRHKSVPRTTKAIPTSSRSTSDESDENAEKIGGTGSSSGSSSDGASQGMAEERETSLRAPHVSRASAQCF